MLESLVREQVDRLRRSPMFEKSERLMAFLQHLVDSALAGRFRLLTEAEIGNAVYGRVREYDARIDSTVRVEARRLRRKLGEYYAQPGVKDPIVISLPVGSYIPVITESMSPAVTVDQTSQPIFRQGFGATLAVLPFRALQSGDESFAEGLTDELIFVLGRSKGLRVLSHSATSAYIKSNAPVSTLAAELSADAILQGTVRGDGEIMRVTIEVAVPTGVIVWSDRIDAPDADRLQLQELVAATLLSRIRFDSSRMRAMQIGAGPRAVEAHARVYKARQLLDQQTPAALREALDIFTQVAQSAPDYARGHSGVADCYCDLYRLAVIDHATAHKAAREAALRALAIDDESIEGHCAQGTICAWLERNREAAEHQFKRALALGENARAARIYGVLLTTSDRHEEAAHLFWEAREMEPFSMQEDIAETLACFQSRRFGEAANRLLRTPPSRASAEALVYAALSRFFSSDLEGARELTDRIDHRAGKYPDFVFARAELEALLGDTGKAAKLHNARHLEASAFARGTLAAALHDADASLTALDLAIERRELSTLWLRTDPRFDQMRSLPRFAQLLEKLNHQAVGPVPQVSLG